MNDDRNSKPLAELVRDRLFRMSPEYWTEKHLEWVGCRFDDVENEELSEGSPQSDVSAIVRGIKKMSEKLNQSGQWAKNIVEEPNADKKTRNMTNLLSQVYSRTFLKRRSHIPFSFAGKEYYWPQLSVHYGKVKPAEDGNNLPPPMLGFHVMNHHSDSCKICRDIELCRNPTFGVVRRTKGVPAECPTSQWPHYPFLGCLLISIAQFQEKIWGQEFECPSYKTQLLVTNVDDSDYIHVYTADFSDELIQALKRPHLATKSIAWPVIEHLKISYKPYNTFQRRLLVTVGALSGDDELEASE